MHSVSNLSIDGPVNELDFFNAFLHKHWTGSFDLKSFATDETLFHWSWVTFKKTNEGLVSCTCFILMLMIEYWIAKKHFQPSFFNNTLEKLSGFWLAESSAVFSCLIEKKRKKFLLKCCDWQCTETMQFCLSSKCEICFHVHRRWFYFAYCLQISYLLYINFEKTTFEAYKTPLHRIWPGSDSCFISPLKQQRFQGMFCWANFTCCRP